MDRTEQSYHSAVGNCLCAIMALRRFAGKEAIEELKSAIRLIENEQRRSEREYRANRAASAPPTSAPPSYDF